MTKFATENRALKKCIGANFPSTNNKISWVVYKSFNHFRGKDQENGQLLTVLVIMQNDLRAVSNFGEHHGANFNCQRPIVK